MLHRYSSKKQMIKEVNKLKKEIKEIKKDDYGKWFFEGLKSKIKENKSKIQRPVIAHFILPAEPHILRTDFYLHPKRWYWVYSTIFELLNEAHESFLFGNYTSCFLCSICAAERFLKFELAKNDIKKANKVFEKGTLGNLQLEGTPLIKFKKKVEKLNLYRSAFFHFNPEKLEKLRKRAQSRVYKKKYLEPGEIEDAFGFPEISSATALKVYNLVLNIIYGGVNPKKFIQTIDKSLEEFHKEIDTMK